MFQIKNLNINLGQFFLKNINLDLNSGEYFIILGKSGAGKTVLLETIAGRYKIKSGNIIKNNEDISKAPPEKRDIGFVYQNYELFYHLNVKDNIGFSLKFKNLSKKDINFKIDEMIEVLGITHLKNRYPKDLSGGEKQRVAIGRSLINSPNLLLLDEPFSALDYITKENVKGIFNNIYDNFKPTIIHVTHDIRETIYPVDKIGILKDNKIVKIFEKKDLSRLESEDILYEYI